VSQPPSRPAAAPAWTSAPSPDEARSRLAAWARRRRTVPDDLFDGPLEVRDASVTTLLVTRLLERREERPVVVTTPPVTLAVYQAPLERVEVGYQGWGAHRWEGLRDGSLRPVQCAACAATGQVVCTFCNGRGSLVCWPRQVCRWCGGSGRGRRLLRGSFTPNCARCAGSGQQVCVRCRGSGWRPCQLCAGGWVRCPVCAGSGMQVEYLHGQVRFWPELAEITFGDPRPLGRGARSHQRRRGQATRPGELPGLPPEIAGRADQELARWPQGQVRVKVEVLVLPAAEVTWDDAGQARTAWLLGEELAPVVPDARKPLRRLAWLRR
jgi:hypothetical protein